MPTCLITGCGGFIGSHLAEHLLADGWSVYGTVRRQRRNLEHLDDPITIGDRSRLSALGWQPRLPIEQTIADTPEFWRRQAVTPVTEDAL